MEYKVLRAPRHLEGAWGDVVRAAVDSLAPVTVPGYLSSATEAHVPLAAMQSSADLVVVASDERDGVVGLLGARVATNMILGGKADTWCYVLLTLVHPNAQRKGIGRGMIEAAASATGAGVVSGTSRNIGFHKALSRLPGFRVYPHYGSNNVPPELVELGRRVLRATFSSGGAGSLDDMLVRRGYKAFDVQGTPVGADDPWLRSLKIRTGDAVLAVATRSGD